MACWFWIGATPRARRKLVGFQTGIREGAQAGAPACRSMLSVAASNIGADLAVGGTGAGARLLEGAR